MEEQNIIFLFERKIWSDHPNIEWWNVNTIINFYKLSKNV